MYFIFIISKNYLWEKNKYVIPSSIFVVVNDRRRCDIIIASLFFCECRLEELDDPLSLGENRYSF